MSQLTDEMDSKDCADNSKLYAHDCIPYTVIHNYIRHIATNSLTSSYKIYKTNNSTSADTTDRPTKHDEHARREGEI